MAPGLRSLLFLDVFFEVVQGLAPEHLVIIDPFVDDAQGLGVEATKAGCALLLGDDEAGSVEKSQVLGDGGAAHAEVARDASHGLTAAAEDPEDFTGVGSEMARKTASCCLRLDQSLPIRVTMWFPIVNECSRLQNQFKVNEGRVAVGRRAALLQAALGIERTSSCIAVEGIQADAFGPASHGASFTACFKRRPPIPWCWKLGETARLVR